MGARSALEQQRIIAMYSGNFYKEILPAMYDASIINQERFLFLMACKEIESSVTTRELLDLAVAWGVTPTPSEFWKTHKSRDDLVTALRRRKTELEKQALEQEQQPFLLAREAEERNNTTSEGKTGRRSSLVVLGSLFPGRETMGDVFGTRGEYTDGIIYMARRVRMDEQSMQTVKAKRKQTSMMAKAARMHARRRLASEVEGGENAVDVEEDDGEWEAHLESQLQDSNGDMMAVHLNSDGTMSNQGESRDLNNAADSSLSSPLSPSGMPNFDSRLNGEMMDPEMRMPDGNTLEDWIRNGQGEKLMVDAGERDEELTALLEPEVMATLPLDGPIIVDGRVRVLCKDGFLHKVIGVRIKGEDDDFGTGDLDDRAAAISHASGIDDDEVMRQNLHGVGKHRSSGMISSASSAVGISANDPFDFMSFVARNDTEPDDAPHMTRDGRVTTLGMDDIMLPAVDENGVLSVMPSSTALGVHSSGLPTPSSPRAMLASSMSISVMAGMNSVNANSNLNSPMGGPVPSATRASKIDLYYRPVTDNDRMVVVIPSRPEEWKEKMKQRYQAGSTSPSRRGSNFNSGAATPNKDALDDFSQKNINAAFTRSGPLSPSAMSNGMSNTGGFPLSPSNSTGIEAASPEKLAMRHRLGGKAGVLARQISGRIREDIPMRDFSLTGGASSPNDSNRIRTNSLSKAGAASIAKSPGSRKA